MHTVEHVLAAIAAHEIDDVLISLDGPEPPIMDGSAGPFFNALREVGYHEHPGCTWTGVLAAPIRMVDGESVYEAHPASDLELDVTIDFPHPVIGRQHGEYVITPSSFGARCCSKSAGLSPQMMVSPMRTNQRRTPARSMIGRPVSWSIHQAMNSATQLSASGLHVARM